jgi:predicted RNA-binding protein with PIN domain
VGWTSYVLAASAELERAASAQASARAEEELARLHEQIAELRGRGRDDVVRLRSELDAAKEEITTLRRTLRRTRDELAAARAQAQTAEQAAQEAGQAAAQATTAAEGEVRRMRARLAEAEGSVESARRAAREGRSLDDARLRLLLDTVVDAAAGLRRELALPPTELRPADVVAAVRPEDLGARDVASRAWAADDPGLLDQLLALPQVHLVVDGYNVTKTGFGDLPLETQRRRLLSGLGAVAAQTGAEVTCCFDGAALDSRVVASAPRGVRVLFSSPGETADELIRRLVRAEPGGRPVVVVSSDREVADGVRRAGARPVAAAALLRRLGRG